MAGVIDAVGKGVSDHLPGSRMPIYVNSGRCGSGKTWRTLERLASKPVRAVFVTDRIAVMEERARTIADAGRRYGRKPVVCAVNSQTSNMKTSVRQQIEARGRELSAVDHAILIITHESMKIADWSAFSGEWEIVIDEAPAMFAAGRHCTSGARSFWESNFELHPVGTTGWSKLSLTVDAVSPGALEADTYMNEVAAFRRRVRGGTVYANVTDWDQTEARGQDWSWISLWNPLELVGFSRVTILANHFSSTMTALLIERFFGDRVQFVDVPMRDDRVWTRRKLNIGYFTDDPRGGSTSFWLGIGHRIGKASDDGKAVLRNIGAWLETNSPADHIMMFNATNAGRMAEIIGAHRVPGTVLSPRQAGTNMWSHVHCATCVYSSKANGFERHLFEGIGVSADEVRRAREYEDILQFVFRTSLRDPASSETVDVRVYDRAQAEFLAHFFEDDPNSYVDVTVYPIADAGVLTVERPRAGRKPVLGLVAADGGKVSAAERQRAYRERLKAEKAATGEPVRRRGRPPGSKNKPKMAA